MARLGPACLRAGGLAAWFSLQRLGSAAALPLASGSAQFLSVGSTLVGLARLQPDGPVVAKMASHAIF